MARPAAEGILVYGQVLRMQGSWPRRTGADLLRDGPFLQATQGDGGEQVGRPRRESSGGRGGRLYSGPGTHLAAGRRPRRSGTRGGSCPHRRFALGDAESVPGRAESQQETAAAPGSPGHSSRKELTA